MINGESVAQSKNLPPVPEKKKNIKQTWFATADTLSRFTFLLSTSP
jgi:hypothetical protein